MAASTCFSSPMDLALRADDLKIGDTCLLDQFLAFCNLYHIGSLFLTAPFFDRRFIDRMLKQTGPDISLTIVVRDDKAAGRVWELLQGCHHRSVCVYIRPRLHAKVYIFECKNQVIATLIGSHNATNAGRKGNVEVGVFVSAANNKSEWAAIQHTRSYLAEQAEFYRDNGYTQKGRV